MAARADRLVAGLGLAALLLVGCAEDANPSRGRGIGDGPIGDGPVGAAVPPATSFRTPPPPEGPVAPSTAAMAARLVQVAERVDPEGNVYQNEARAAARQQRVDAEGGPQQAPLMAVLDLGREQLLAGWPGEALATFDVVSARMQSMDAQLNPQLVDEFERLLILAWLRLGEQQNCLEHHSTESCLMPFEGGGVHGQRTGSERALELLRARLTQRPKDWEARWLFNLAAMTLGRWPEQVPAEWLLPPAAFASAHDPGRFVDVARDAGCDVVGLAGGVVADDLDGDGHSDLLISSWGLSDNLRLLRNRGDGTFEDVTAEAGLSGIVGGLNLTHADPDNDGDLDALVLRGAWFEQDGGHPNSYLRNDGRGVFADATVEAGLLSSHPTQTAKFADINGDGWLELFIGNETGPYETHPCELYWNDGDGTFTEVAAQVGLDLTGYVKGVAFGDIDLDGDPDLYVSRIDGPNWLLRNDGPASGAPGPAAGDANPGPPQRGPARPCEPWVFTDITAAAGVGQPARSFPTWFFDHDQDGDLDLFVSGYRYGSAAHVAKDMLGRQNKGVQAKLYENLGDGAFADVSAAAGLDKVLLTMGCNWGDIDEDGWPDLYLSTGEPDLAGIVPNRMFRNMADGSFADVTTAGGFGHVQKGHAIAFADFDEDGDQDVYAVMGGAYSGDVFPNALFQNPGHGKRWLRLRLEGVAANRDAIGARVALSVRESDGAGGEVLRTIHRVVGTGGSFGSNSLVLELGLGDATAIEQLRIVWPGSGRVQVLRDLELDSALHVREG